MAPGTFTIAFPLGVTVGKWTRVFEQRHGDVELTVVRARPDELRALLDSGDVDLAFVRLPVEPEALHIIPLYDENVVAVMNHEHVLTLEKKLQLAEIADEPVVEPSVGAEPDEVMMRKVAAGDGIAVLPQSVAKALRRRDVVAMRLEDSPPASVALAWLRETENAWVDEFIGIVRGRSAHSSRNPDVAAAEAAESKNRDAAKASAAKAAAAKSGAAKSGGGKKGAGAKSAGRKTATPRGARGSSARRGRRR